MRDQMLEPDGKEGGGRQMLNARPLRNRAAASDDHGPRGLTLRIPRKRPRWLLPPVAWIIVVRDHSRVTLDSLGAQVWTLCDGQRTVENVVDDFAAAHGLSFHEARVAVTQYLRLLIRRGVLAVELAERAEGPGQA